MLLRTKILLLVAGVAIGLSGVVAASLSVLAARGVNEAVRADVRATGGVLGQFVRERGNALVTQSTLLARQSALPQVVMTHDPATAQGVAGEYKKQVGADAVLLTDMDGRALADTGGGVSPKADARAEPGVADALHAAPGDPVRPRIAARGGRLMLCVCAPIFYGPYVQGTFSAYRSLDGALARDMKRALGTDVAFVVDGRVEGASRPLPPTLPTPTGTPQPVTLDGAKFFALYAPLPGTNPADKLGFVTLRPYASAMAFYNRMRAALALVMLLTLAGALAAGVTLARGLTRPLDGVVHAAEVLREGGWPEQFAVTRTDEIGLLQTVFNDMTVSLRDSRDKLLALVDTDPLTGLDNHRRFQERLAQEAVRCGRSGEALSLLLVDIDHFAAFNQQAGHAAGDDALRGAADALRASVPPAAICARYGGDKFAALLPGASLARAEQSAELARMLMRTAPSPVRTGEGEQEKAVNLPPPRLGGPGGPASSLTLSIGIAEFGTHTAQAEGLTLAAELALSRAKQLGRNRVCRFDSVPGADAHADPYQLHRFLKDESLATIQALAAAVDAKDPYTQGHSARVARYACELAQWVGLSEAEVDQIHTTGTLHDVGKIGVPDAILKKPGRLDEDERAVMETHPALGEVIVKKVPALAWTLPGVRHHHERWDGKGYPDKLAGEDIPRMARLLAVADTYDAMTSDRPYRKGLSVDVALTEIARGAGTQFDPSLAPAFVEMMQAQMEQAA